MAISGYANKQIDKLINVRKAHVDLQKSMEKIGFQGYSVGQGG